MANKAYLLTERAPESHRLHVVISGDLADEAAARSAAATQIAALDREHATGQDAQVEAKARALGKITDSNHFDAESLGAVALSASLIVIQGKRLV